MSKASATARIALLILLPVWAGIVTGVSLLATPVKFQAQSLSMPVALEIGRYTFRLLGHVELCFWIATVIAACIARARRPTLILLGLVTLEVVLQRYWLLPALDNRVSQILAGGPVSFVTGHWVYAFLEVAKVILLITAAIVEYRSHPSAATGHARYRSTNSVSR